MTNKTSSDWATHAEQTDFRETPSYADTIDFCRRLAEASTVIEFQSFGKSGQGRDLPLLIASETQAFTPTVAKAGKKAIVLIQACIHSGEPDGKDAGFALLRDLAITKTVAGILENVVLLFIPIYNTDGHERSSQYNRINQNGPVSMGWRTTRTYQNLNRDYVKADTPETRAWHALWNKWQPDLFIDCHVSDGADYRSNITFHYERHAGIDPEIIEWERNVFSNRVAQATADAGNTISWYLEFIDNRDLPLGMRDFNGPPRFSTGYVPLRNRPAILIETHMLKDYRSRVKGTYDFLHAALTEVNKDPQQLIDLGQRADLRAHTNQTYPLNFKLTDSATPFDLKAFNYTTEQSEISGDLRVIYGDKPLDLTVPMYETLATTVSVEPPVSYVVPVEWNEVIEVLESHGLSMQKLSSNTSIPVESYRFLDVEWPSTPFEGRHMPRFSVTKTDEVREFAAGSVVVPFAQPLARLVMNLLEPQAPDSFVHWGFFNAIFEEKEYGEPYVLEQLARDMIAANPELQIEFVKALTEDPQLARNPYERLKYFYKRSPYWDPQMDLYPVGRIRSALDLPGI
ncbi:MAG TPA: M14 family metallopeptidase [Pyrinomonadaceae bacterium]|nr:M14 family metallopeptidase [Pyrinomonadaceae bacterium]